MNNLYKEMFWSVISVFLFTIEGAFSILLIAQIILFELNWEKAFLIYFLMSITFLWGLVLWKLKDNIRKVLKGAAKITIIVVISLFLCSTIVYWLTSYSLRLFMFQIPYLIITGWIYYIFNIAKGIRFNVTDIVLWVSMLALLSLGLHLFMKRFYAELRSFRNEIQIAWPLKRTIVSVAIVTLMFVTGISTTASIHQLIWIANAPTRFGIIRDTSDSFVERSIEWTTSEKSIEGIAKWVVSHYLQDFLDSYIAGKPYRIVKDSDGTKGCIEASNAKASNASTMGTTCRVYHEAASATYTAFPDGINEVLNDFINHANNMGNHIGKELREFDWFSWQSLFVAKHTREGEIVLATVNSHAVSVTVYAESFNVPIFSTVVTARKQKDETNITY